jgi:hypothetical protein
MNSPSNVYLQSVPTSSPEAPKIRRHPSIYNAMQVHNYSPVVEIFGDLRELKGSNSRQYHTSLEEYTMQSSTTTPLYLIQPRLVLEDSPLSRVYTGFRDAARYMIATGTPAMDITNGKDVVVDMFFRERRPSDAFTCASWASELCRSFGDADEIPRLASVFLLTRLMRVCKSIMNFKRASSLYFAVDDLPYT